MNFAHAITQPVCSCKLHSESCDYQDVLQLTIPTLLPKNALCLQQVHNVEAYKTKNVFTTKTAALRKKSRG